MEEVYTTLTARATALKTLCDDKNQHRVVVALAGPPGSGKSTIAATVVQRLNSISQGPFAAAVPMDGFHLSRAELDQLPNREEAYARRGASWTFDAAGVIHLITTLSNSRTSKSATPAVILAPSFDHAAKDPLKDGIVLSPDITFIILEGNYLLLDEEPWSGIARLVDDTWFVDVLPELARERIAKRHLLSGIESNWEDAVKRAEGNDLLNGVVVREKLVRPAVGVWSVQE